MGQITRRPRQLLAQCIKFQNRKEHLRPMKRVAKKWSKVKEKIQHQRYLLLINELDEYVRLLGPRLFPDEYYDETKEINHGQIKGQKKEKKLPRP